MLLKSFVTASATGALPKFAAATAAHLSMKSRGKIYWALHFSNYDLAPFRFAYRHDFLHDICVSRVNELPSAFYPTDIPYSAARLDHQQRLEQASGYGDQIQIVAISCFW